MKAELAVRLQTLLNANVAALRLWFSQQEADARSLAADIRIREGILALSTQALSNALSGDALAKSQDAATVRLFLKPLMEGMGYSDYVVISSNLTILASLRDDMVGQRAPAAYEPFLRRALSDQTAVSRPFFDAEPGPGEKRSPTMFVAAPVKTDSGAIPAILALRMRPEAEFTSIFSVGRLGETGEAYAFDYKGVMLSASRFDEDLKAAGLLTNQPGVSTILNLRLSAPNPEKRASGKSTPVSEPRLTRMAAAATAGSDGADVDGYRNYLGVSVIGAWAWLPRYGMGVAVEVSTDEAFQTLYTLRRVFMTLFLLLAVTGAAIFAFTFLVERLQASVRRSALAARRLGQYSLVQEIGRGATGIVYRARHTLLRRPVAVKLLHPEMTNETNIAQFEHEVQMTSQLTHPNTVAIYDYGRTPEGLFYYAMEYLRGIDLDRLVREFGPQPEGRVIHILRQVCGSVAEAHRIGLIHRDIKPANIVLTRRGSVCDVVKVLDFGLVKAPHLHPRGVEANAVVGTPHFMPPEAIQSPDSVDSRSDIYSVGAVGYWLLTGRTMFDRTEVSALLESQLNQQPMKPADRLGTAASSDLQEFIMHCLAKNPDDRPQTAEACEKTLGECATAGQWTLKEAESWWRQNLGGIDSVPAGTMAEKTLVIAPRPGELGG
jgi:tRNA A-37 threonylcarbamoyl transferase component Bud32